MLQLVVGVMRPRQSRSLTSSVFFLDVRGALSVSLQRTSLLTNRQGRLRGGAGGVGAAITPCFGPSHFPVLRQGAGCGPLSTLRSRGGGEYVPSAPRPMPAHFSKMETSALSVPFSPFSLLAHWGIVVVLGMGSAIGNVCRPPPVAFPQWRLTVTGSGVSPISVSWHGGGRQ